MSYIRKKRKKRSFIKRLFKPKYRFIRREYYSNFNVISHVSDLEKILSFTLGKEIKVENTIDFRNIPFGKTTSELTLLMGEPRFTIDNSKRIKGHIIFFYKEKISNVSLKIQIHFLNNRFYYANYLFNGNKITAKFKKEIIGAIALKFKNDEIKLSNQTLTDPLENKMIIRDDVNFDISFISGSIYFKSIFENFAEKKKTAKTGNEIDRIKKLF